MGRTYQGYMQANQSVLEEEEEEEDNDNFTGGDLEAGHASRSGSLAKGKQRAGWAPDSSEMNVLRPNIKQDDQRHANDDSDDEVPQDFMIETARKPSQPQSTAYKGKERGSLRQQPLYSTSRKQAPPILPSAGHVSVPPRPSELDVEEDSPPTEQLTEPKLKQMRGLDNYERALWNWVNVYNLDAFLQEAYYYYEGKGIYSIALSRGLNLLSVILSFVRIYHLIEISIVIQNGRVCDWLLYFPVGMHRLFANTTRKGDAAVRSCCLSMSVQVPPPPFQCFLYCSHDH